MAEKINPADFGFNKSDWKNLNSQVREWIKLNKELWNNMTAYEKQQAKAHAKTSKDIKAATQGYEDIQDITKKIHNNLKDSAATNKLNATIVLKTQDISKQYFKESEKGKKADKMKLKSWKGIVDLSQDFMINQDTIGTDEFRSLDVNKQIRDAKKAGNIEQLEYLETLKLEHDVQKKLNAEINAQADLIKKPFGTLDDMVKRIPIVGDMLSAKLDLTGKGQDMADKFTESARDAISGAKGEVLGWNAFQKSKKGQGMDSKGIAKQYKEHKKGGAEGKKGMGKMGVAAIAVGTAIASWAVGTLNFAREMGLSFSELSLTSVLFKEETKAMLDEFGSLRDVSDGLLFNMKWQAFWTGASATDMAKVMKLQQSITTDSKEMALDKQAAFMKQIKKEGLSAAKVMGDLAGHADMFANFAKDGGKNMEEAAKQAAAMGLTLDATNAVAESLLDWETSIAAEQEASMILGRSINLDKARQLAYDGKLVPMMEEVKRQAGGEAEFAKMSVVHRQALGAAIGLQGAQLAEFIKVQDASEAKEKEGAAKRIAMWTVFGALAMGLVVGIISALTLGAATIPALAAGATGFKLGAILGGALGMGAAVMTAGDVMSPAKGKTQISPKEGGIYNLSKNDDFMAGPGIASGGGAPVVNIDMSPIQESTMKMVELMQQRNEQAEKQSRKGISATEGAFAQR